MARQHLLVLAAWIPRAQRKFDKVSGRFAKSRLLSFDRDDVVCVGAHGSFGSDSRCRYFNLLPHHFCCLGQLRQRM